MKCVECGKEIKAGDRIFFHSIGDEKVINNSTGCVCIDVDGVFHADCLVNSRKNKETKL